MSGNVLMLEERSESLASMAVAIGFPLRSSSLAPWHAPSVKSALSVPAIFRAVSLISGTAGTLPMEVWRNGELLPPEQRPRLVVRPNPLTHAAHLLARHGLLEGHPRRVVVVGRQA